MASDKKKAKKPAPKTTTQKKLAKAQPSEQPNDDVRVVQVAQMIGVGYLKARDMMLRGRLGDSAFDARGRLTVKRAAVEAFRRSVQDAPTSRAKTGQPAGAGVAGRKSREKGS